MQWEDVYAELRNKIRWSISSTATSVGISLSYEESLKHAKCAASQVVEDFKTRTGSSSRQKAPELPTLKKDLAERAARNGNLTE